MNIILGLAGALMGVALFLLGCWFEARRLPKSRDRPTEDDETTDEGLEEQLKREQARLAAEQRAFTDLMGYNVDDVYGGKPKKTDEG